MRRAPLCLCLAALVLASSPALSAEASGQFASWTVVDAIAVSSDDGIEISFSDKPFDRAAIAADYRFDIRDRDFHESSQQGTVLSLRLDAEGAVTGLGMGGSSMYSSDMDAALKLDKRSADAIAGRFTIADIQLQFDLPVWKNGGIPRVGTPLPKDGGEAGKALQAYLAALAGNDFDTFVALSPPTWRESMNAAKAKSEAQLEIDAVRSELPEAIKPVGGHGEPKRAWIDLDATRDGKAVKAVATLERDEAGWYVRRIEVL